MSRRDEIIKKIHEIPAIPVSAARAVVLLSNPDRSLSEVIKVIEYDPGITANILKLVNSSAFYAGREISSLNEAVVRLGANNVLQLLIGSSMASYMDRKVKGYDLPPGELWKFSVTSAICAEITGEVKGIKLPQYTFTAGLLHDIGKIVLGSFIDVNAAEIIRFSEERSLSFPEAEREMLGIDHSEAGAVLLEKWNLPKNLCVPVRWHHDPDSCDAEDHLVTDIIHIADALTLMGGIGAGREGLKYRISDNIAAKYSLDVETIEMIIFRTQMRFEELKDAFQLGQKTRGG